VLELEKVRGTSLPEATSEITSSKSNFVQFVKECLEILAELESAGIQHRDIQPNNLMVRQGKPVLLDFGWAMTERMPMLLPAGLLSLTPDGQACDAYAMGRILSDLAQDKFPELLCVFELMTEPDPAARITDAKGLITLAELAVREQSEKHETGETEATDTAAGGNSKLLQKLVANLRISRARLKGEREEYRALVDRMNIEKDHRLAVLEMEYEKVVTEINKVIPELKRVIGEKDELLTLLDERQKLIEGITQSQAWRLASRLQQSKKSFGSMFGKTP
jgi:uncharacterized coiled-coil protein SlyX